MRIRSKLVISRPPKKAMKQTENKSKQKNLRKIRKREKEIKNWQNDHPLTPFQKIETIIEKTMKESNKSNRETDTAPTVIKVTESSFAVTDSKKETIN